jgi:hypothetical protein
MMNERTKRVHNQAGDENRDVYWNSPFDLGAFRFGFSFFEALLILSSLLILYFDLLLLLADDGQAYALGGFTYNLRYCDCTQRTDCWSKHDLKPIHHTREVSNEDAIHAKEQFTVSNFVHEGVVEPNWSKNDKHMHMQEVAGPGRWRMFSNTLDQWAVVLCVRWVNQNHDSAAYLGGATNGQEKKQ